jgi:uncharacterized membrane protein YeaQ/YmgE (transglycosylase-associated protein family)
MSVSASILFGLALVWCLFWTARATRGWALPVVLAVVGAVQWLLADSGFYGDTTGFPPPQSALLAPMVIGLCLVFLLPAGWRWSRNTDLTALTALHILRMPVELVLHEAYLEGLVPRSMTYSGHNFDIITGLSAAFLTAWLVSRKKPSKGVLVAWNILGIVLLAIVVVTAVFSIPSSVQRWNFDQPNILVVSVPWVLLPAVLVPAVLWAHITALFNLLGKARPEAAQPAG